jgi:hypothetical protein
MPTAREVRCRATKRRPQGPKLTAYSDILAELPYPHSGILTYEEDMPAPNLQAARDIDGLSDLVLESYSAQLYLRKHLNMLHTMFYNPDG